MSEQSPAGPSTTTDNGSKVAIPRLSSFVKPSKEDRRTTVACTACRKHKIRCSGDYPQCQSCHSAGRDCVYMYTRRDRLKMVTQQNAMMTDLLRDLRVRTNPEDTARIDQALHSVEQSMSRNVYQQPASSYFDGAQGLDERSSEAASDTQSPTTQTFMADPYMDADQSAWANLALGLERPATEPAPERPPLPGLNHPHPLSTSVLPDEIGQHDPEDMDFFNFFDPQGPV
ncbi:hypothetical protein BU24DRAFT_79233 [Aaosphaeria arxii CBS 175.79]|uniref:Zn(2)-C6 fungal-type domain-containing protein n=1 Tax=Aaosphaeria arxii CBS 175.79 TaxID=1450172 RepID=A0A6A5X9G2_9PLEO|nr:uncharacterized protein BU24DRAFT_79233 [Aaosphaeria arxii CBS 175.79]KAF2009608.1 hypothetical protein BU24DRAFT_79233 [Aaosphaeria arxii CBS 175.79]